MKKKDMGIASAVIVLAQFLSTFQSSHNVSGEIRDLKRSIEHVKIEQEKYFVRKEELKTVVTKLDHLASELSRMNDQIKSMRKDYAMLELDGDEVCSIDLNERAIGGFL